LAGDLRGGRRGGDRPGLLARGATLADVGQPATATFNVLRDPEGNELCVLSAREG